MKKLWILIPVFIVWFFSQRGQLKSPLDHSKKVFRQTPRVKPSDSQKSVDEKRWRVQDHHELHIESYQSPLGKTVVHNFSQNGVPIVGMDIRLREQPSGVLLEEENTYRPINEVPIHRAKVAVRATELKAIAGRYDLSSLSADSLVILVRDGISEGELAFATTAIDRAGTGEPTQLIIRVDDGKVLKRSFGRRESHTKN